TAWLSDCAGIATSSSDPLRRRGLLVLRSESHDLNSARGARGVSRDYSPRTFGGAAGERCEVTPGTSASRRTPRRAGVPPQGTSVRFVDRLGPAGRCPPARPVLRGQLVLVPWVRRWCRRRSVGRSASLPS